MMEKIYIYQKKNYIFLIIFLLISLEVVMNSSDKVKLLQKEIGYINDENLKNDAIYLVSILPDYFFEVDASSTGKYHPKYASGDKGLLRHVKAAVKMAVELLANPIIEKPYSSRDKDLIVLALIVHDGLKYGKIKLTSILNLSIQY